MRRYWTQGVSSDAGVMLWESMGASEEPTALSSELLLAWPSALSFALLAALIAHIVSVFIYW